MQGASGACYALSGMQIIVGQACITRVHHRPSKRLQCNRQYGKLSTLTSGPVLCRGTGWWSLGTAWAPAQPHSSRSSSETDLKVRTGFSDLWKRFTPLLVPCRVGQWLHNSDSVHGSGLKSFVDPMVSLQLSVTVCTAPSWHNSQNLHSSLSASQVFVVA